MVTNRSIEPAWCSHNMGRHFPCDIMITGSHGCLGDSLKDQSLLFSRAYKWSK